MFRLLRVLLEELVREALLGDQHWFKCKPFGFGVANLIPEFCSKQSTPGKIRDTKHPVGGSTHGLPLRVLHRASPPKGFELTVNQRCFASVESVVATLGKHSAESELERAAVRRQDGTRSARALLRSTLDPCP